MMKTYKAFVLAAFCLIIVDLACAQSAEDKVTQYVNPFIGTGAVNGSSLSGNTYPGATSPFGMVQLSPDTRDEPEWDAACGYNYNDKTIAGFSHTHLSGTGAPDFFDILFMPITGQVHTRAGNANEPNSGYRSRFSHSEESARAGYYQVKLLDYNINAELTTSTHTGFHRYTFPKNSEAHVVIDLDHSLKKPNWGCKVINAQFKVKDNKTIEGYRVITGWAKLRKIYFHAEFSKPITNQIIADGGTVYQNNSVVNGTDLRAVLDFDTNDETPLLVKIGISAVSIENARLNMQEEIPHWDFDRAVAQADDVWEKELSKIQVSGTKDQKQIFYTSLYHAFIQPNALSDVNGDYPSIDYAKRNTGSGKQYSTFSLWDTYRGAHPLYTLLQPARTADFVNSMIRQYEDYGYLPIWQLWGQENYCMIGNHSIPVIVDAVLKGIPGIDINKAYEAIKSSSTVSHPGSPFDVWEKYKYIPENKLSQSVSITLEMAYDDWCVAQLAKKLGKTDDYNHFMDRSQFYKKLYDTQTGFFRARDDNGKWLTPFNPLQYGSNGGNPYTEGNAWQYYWYVPQDIPSLVELTGGKQAFENKLDSFFTITATHGEVNGNASGFIGQYAHGNEPSHHVTYLYNYAGQPWKTQFYVSKVLSELYTNNSAGYSGNDDCGEMSAWYVFSAMGFYPVNPASGIYDIGTPLLGKAVLKMPNGKVFTMIAKNISKENIYIQTAKLNGKDYHLTYITQQDLEDGSTLEFTMGSKPNKKWGVAKIK
ncbi:GH92 family glycosyl hydrolase [Chitinophagaceae bacterium 26-R-25]|nr:GH92 family glycosyl hydrolase [Chitinophagaceae bacterium 26-R-25]